MRDKTKVLRITAVLFALLFWQILAMAVGRSYLLSSPAEVCQRLAELAVMPNFCLAAAGSTGKVVLGFVLGAVIGSTFGICSYRFHIFRIYIGPYIAAIRSIPVASFAIIILIWLGSGALSTVVCFLMVLPIFYSNILEGMRSVDKKMLQVAAIFKLDRRAKAVYIYMPALESFIISAATASTGIAFKSGIAAEVIAGSAGSLGYFMFEAKMYIETAQVFAVTLIIIILSALFERLILFIMNYIFRLIKRLY